MKEFILTEEMLKKAKSYMPLKEKQINSRIIADKCVKKDENVDFKAPEKLYEAAGENEDLKKSFLADEVITWLYKSAAYKTEDIFLKNVLLLNVFLNYYLDIPIDKKADPYEVYDYYMGSHIYNQLERLKTGTYKCKVFDIISDFKEFKKYVDAQIHSNIAEYNDTVTRIVTVAKVFNNTSIMKEIEKLLPKETEAEKIIAMNKAKGQANKLEMKKGIDEK